MRVRRAPGAGVAVLVFGLVKNRSVSIFVSLVLNAVVCVGCVGCDAQGENKMRGWLKCKDGWAEYLNAMLNGISKHTRGAKTKKKPTANNQHAVSFKPTQALLAP